MATQSTPTQSSFVQPQREHQAAPEGQQSAMGAEDEWKTVLRTVLRLPNGQEALAVTLFLLDTLAFLRSMIDTSTRERDDKTEIIMQFLDYQQAIVSSMILLLSVPSR